MLKPSLLGSFTNKSTPLAAIYLAGSSSKRELTCFFMLSRRPGGAWGEQPVYGLSCTRLAFGCFLFLFLLRLRLSFKVARWLVSHYTNELA